MPRTIKVGMCGHAGLVFALTAAVAGVPVPVSRAMVPILPPHFKDWPEGRGCRRWRSCVPGKPRPHILSDGSVRVKGFKPRSKKLRTYDPPAPNYKGSKYEKGES